MSLGESIEQEAREQAQEHFGSPTSEQTQRVIDCAWDIFIFHAATGGDADCWCGAHVSSLRSAAGNGGSVAYDQPNQESKEPQA